MLHGWICSFVVMFLLCCYIQVNNEREQLLFHPTVLALVHFKWKAANLFYMAFLLFYTLFVALLTADILDRDYVFTRFQ